MPSVLGFAHAVHITHIFFFLSSKALDDAFCLLGLIAELSKGVKELLHLLLQGCVVPLRVSPSPLRLHDLSLDSLVPVPLLREVGFQPNNLDLQLFISLLEAGGKDMRKKSKRQEYQNYLVWTQGWEVGEAFLAMNRSERRGQWIICWSICNVNRLFDFLMPEMVGRGRKVVLNCTVKSNCCIYHLPLSS